MRDIKFRAWDKDLQKFVNAPFKNQDRGTLYAIGHKQDCELQEYTGLRDKNGTEIYEGDILRVHSLDKDHDGQLMAVEWGKLGWTVKSKNWYSLTDHDKFSIVGNIFENPTLL